MFTLILTAVLRLVEDLRSAMRRILLTLPEARCPFGCQYCFAEFSQYERPISFTDIEHSPELLEGIDVVYPACDVDLFATNKPLEILRRAAALGPSISVSTKAALSDQLVVGLARLAEDPWFAVRAAGHCSCRGGLCFARVGHFPVPA